MKSVYIVVTLILVSCVFGVATQIVKSPELVVQQEWFFIGYRYSGATKPTQISELRDQLPDDPPPELITLINKWARGEVDKQAVRPALLAHARSHGGCLGFVAFRLGEWIYALEDAWFRFVFGLIINDEQMVWEAMEDTMILTGQAQEFIDALSGVAPPEVSQTLQNILDTGSKLTFVPIFLVKDDPDKIERVLEEVARAFAEVLGRLSDWIKKIKTAYGVK